MTLTVNIVFKLSLELPEVFAICQKAVNTPEGVEHLTTWRGLSNPVGIGADCWMEVFTQSNGAFVVSLDIPYSGGHLMHGIAQRVLDSLGVTEFSVYNEWDDTWHDNLDWLKP